MVLVSCAYLGQLYWRFLYFTYDVKFIEWMVAECESVFNVHLNLLFKQSSDIYFLQVTLLFFCVAGT